MKIGQRFLAIKNGSKFWWLQWFPAKNHPTQTFLPPLHCIYEPKFWFSTEKLFSINYQNIITTTAQEQKKLL